MKIAFVHFGRENLGIEYISSVLKKSGHQTYLAYDPGLFSIEDNVFYAPFLEKIFKRKKKLIQELEKIEPDLIAFSVYTSTYTWSCDIAKSLKKRLKAKTVFGGIHSTLVPEIVINNDFVDFVIQGEGEYALLELTETLNSKSGNFQIPGLWYKKESNIISNPLRQPIQNLDSLPLPDKGLFERFINYKR
ncbi:MAG: hypothetical protein DRP74_05205 [Candidatus Omnitrophota bacterium]|nr:MAG: hypothetical protein DRP74_05205 [Candidatus Omnitrophota bacterium]